MTKTTDEDFRKMAQQIMDICRDLYDKGPTAIRISKHLARDGYPAQSMGGSGGKGVHDPVGELVVSPAMVDPVRNSVTRMLKALEQALANAKDAEGALHIALHQEPQPDKIVRDSSISDCVNCGEQALPRPKAGRCPSCYEFRRRTGEDRPRVAS